MPDSAFPNGVPSHPAPDSRAMLDSIAPLWFNLSRYAWQSLALVPGRADGSVLPAARALADVARLYLEEPVHLLDGENLSAMQVTACLRAIRERVATGARVVIALSSPLRSHSATPIARAADATLLVVEMEETTVGEARSARDLIGADRFIGTINLLP